MVPVAVEVLVLEVAAALVSVEDLDVGGALESYYY